MEPQMNTSLALENSSTAMRQKVLRLAGPAIVENLLHSMVGIIDTAMVGRLGAYALAAVGLANQIFNISLTVFAALATGSTALVARFIGAHDEEEAAEVTRQSLVMGLVLAGTILAVLVALGPAILRLLFRRSEEAIYHGGQYVRMWHQLSF